VTTAAAPLKGAWRGMEQYGDFSIGGYDPRHAPL